MRSGRWDLACGLVQYAPEKRLSAEGALAHPAITASPLTKAVVKAKHLASSAEAAAAAFTEPWLSATSGQPFIPAPPKLDPLAAFLGRPVLCHSSLCTPPHRASSLGESLKIHGNYCFVLGSGASVMSRVLVN